ncbi:MAG: putative glycolipid-binding domain-containing protein [Micromonosporaceae bacterium]
MERFTRDLMWQREAHPGVEHALLDDTAGLRARGTMVAGERRPYTLRYSLATDDRWGTSHLEVESEGAGWRRRVRLVRSEDGWQVTTHEQGGDRRMALPGTEAPEQLADAIDVDLGYSPLFNTLPVRRRGLLDQPEGTAETYLMVFVTVPELVVTPSEQTYTVLGDGRIRYASGSFTADLRFDPDGYVHHYPGLATRL